MNQPRNELREVAIAVCAVWLVLCAILFFMFGARPRTGTGWLVFILLGPPAYALAGIMGEALVERVDRGPGLRSLNARVTARSAGVRFSWLRVSYLLLRTILMLAVFAAFVVGIRYVAPEPVRYLEEFLARHFAAV